MTLEQKIKMIIKENGPISFSEFMQFALYDETEGFYAHGAPDNLFERILCNVETTDGLIQAWTYRWTGSVGTRIESGEWSKR